MLMLGASQFFPQETSGGRFGHLFRFDIQLVETFVADRKLQRVDLIKIDTDGHEWAVLTGAKETIRKFRPVVLFELALYLLEENHVSYEMIETYFSELGYRLMSAESGQSVSSSNVFSMVPENGSLDAIAHPQS